MQNYGMLIYLPLQNTRKDWYEYFIIQYFCQSHFYLRYRDILKGNIGQGNHDPFFLRKKF